MNDWSKAEWRVQQAHRLYEEGRWVEAANLKQATLALLGERVARNWRFHQPGRAG